jgi:hypothetical protein
MRKLVKHIVRPSVIGAVLFAALGIRAAAPAGRYTISSGTVRDTKTGLTWQQSPDTAMYNSVSIGTHCSSQGLSGAGWRLPTYKELVTLVDYSVAAPGPTIDATAFPATQPAGCYWSLDTSGAGLGLIDFRTGASSVSSTNTNCYIRCVR